MPIPQITAIAKIVASLERRETLNPFPSGAKIKLSAAIQIGAWALAHVMKGGTDIPDEKA